LISNCSAEEVHGLAGSALMRFIDEPILSCEVRCTKPHEEIYLLACGKLNVSPSEAIFIGDGGADELNGASRVGLKAYRATWFINRCPTGDAFPQITDPMHVLDLLG
jgi:putative hydrolase of the HAD superfamily